MDGRHELQAHVRQESVPVLRRALVQDAVQYIVGQAAISNDRVQHAVVPYTKLVSINLYLPHPPLTSPKHIGRMTNCSTSILAERKSRQIIDNKKD